MANENSITIRGIVYVTHDALTFGDYGGFGDCGLANIRTVLADHEGEYAERHGGIMECSMGDLRHANEGSPYGLAVDVLEEITSEKPAVIHTYGDYSNEQVWIREDVDAEYEYTSMLETYPCLDDEETSKVVMEWEEEAWDSWVKSDLLRTLSENEQDRAEDLGDSVLRQAYQDAMESENQYPEAEHSGVHIPVDRIRKAFGRNVRAVFAEQDEAELQRQRAALNTPDMFKSE